MDELTQDEASVIMRQSFKPMFGWAAVEIIASLDEIHYEYTGVEHCLWIHRSDIARYACTCQAGVMVLTVPANVAGAAWRN